MVTQPMDLGEWSAIYLELLDNELCTLSLEGTIDKNSYAHTLDSFPESYMLLISVSSTPISFHWHSAMVGHG